MRIPNSWHLRAMCSKCKWHTPAPHGKLFHIPYECCPACGSDKSTENWHILKMRIAPGDVSNVRWWKPWTWGNTIRGEWEVKPS